MRIAFTSFLFLFVVSILIDWEILNSIRKFARKRIWSKYYLWSSIVCWIYLIVVYLWPKRNVDEDILLPMWLMFFYFTLYLFKACIALFSLLGRIPRLFSRRRLPLGLWIGVPVGLMAFCALWYGALWGRDRIEVVDVDIHCPRLPEAFVGYRIAQFSDIHVGTWGNDTAFISRLVDSINAQHPNLILFTGDIVNRTTTELRPFIPVLSRLKAPDGVYSILGNHDYGDYITWPNEALRLANNRLLDSWQRKMGWTLLNNSHRFITRDRTIHDSIARDTMVLIGVENWGEPPFRQYGDLTKAYPTHPDSAFNVHDDRFKLLMTHNPEHWRRVTSAQTNIDLTLSGHTHAMQIQLKAGEHRFSPSSLFYKFWGGLYIMENKDGDLVQLYVNVGAGEVGMPFRIGATPEITVFTLYR